MKNNTYFSRYTHYYIYIVIVTVAAMMSSSLSSCRKKVGKTNIIVMDSIRHYYSVIQGQELQMTWRIANVGDAPLVISDIQPSCGCISDDKENNNIILPGGEGKLKFKFNTEKYSGYVKHVIRIFGNIRPNGMLEFIFDTNVVPPYNGSPDYEDVYYQWLEDNQRLEGIMDEAANERGYWTDEGNYSKSHSRYPWKDEKKDVEY